MLEFYDKNPFKGSSVNHYNKLEEAIKHFMRFDATGSQLPQCLVLDADNSFTKRISIYIRLSNDGDLGEHVIVANKAYLDNRAFEISLCHELGHVISFRKKVNVPPEHFINVFKNEMAADKEGFRLFALSVPGSSKYFQLYKDNCRDLFNSIWTCKGRKKKIHHMQCFLINAIRAIYCLFLFSKKKFVELTGLRENVSAVRVVGTR